MKRIIIILLTGTLFLTACGQTPCLTQPTSIPVIEQTSSPSPLPTSTQTPIPSATPTASITPLPTIPTFTPTFDASTIVTVTPAPKAECPDIQSDVNINLSNFDDYYPELIAALNQGRQLRQSLMLLRRNLTNIIFQMEIYCSTRKSGMKQLM